MSSSSFSSGGTAGAGGGGGAAVVESHSVQSQFASLTRDRDTLRWQVEAADRQRRQQEGQLGELRALQGNLSVQLQTAHASLGSFQKQKALLEQERVRLSTVLRDEKQELLESANKLQLLVETQQHSKHAFLQEMGEWNQELEQLLEQAENAEWKRCISTQTIDMVETAAAANGANVIDMDAMGAAKALWKQAVDNKTQQEKVYNDLKNQVEVWRARAKEQQPNLDWEQLEKAWEHDTSSKDSAITVDLFYGGAGRNDDSNPAVESLPIITNTTTLASNARHEGNVATNVATTIF